MLNDKEIEVARKEFGRLMTRQAIIARTIYEYQKEYADIVKKVDALYNSISGEPYKETEDESK